MNLIAHKPVVFVCHVVTRVEPVDLCDEALLYHGWATTQDPRMKYNQRFALNLCSPPVVMPSTSLLIREPEVQLRDLLPNLHFQPAKVDYEFSCPRSEFPWIRAAVESTPGFADIDGPELLGRFVERHIGPPLHWVEVIPPLYRELGIEDRDCEVQRIDDPGTNQKHIRVNRTAVYHFGVNWESGFFMTPKVFSRIEPFIDRLYFVAINI